jgi:hypothetical protein
LPTPRPSGTIQDMQQLEPPILALLATALELFFAWLIFRVVPKSWREDRFGAYVIVFGFLVAVNWALFSLSASGWLAKPENASTVQAVSTAAQAVFAVVLIGVAVFTLRANADMARETERMAEVAVQQQRAAIKPVLVFRVWSTSDVGRRPAVDAFRIEVINVGAGPALETVVHVNGPPLRYQVKSFPLQPAVITPAEPVPFEFLLDEDAPFVDESESLRWTPDEELERQIAAHESTMRMTQPNSDEYNRLKTARRQHRHGFHRAVADRVAGLPRVGSVQIDYVDLAGTPYRSTAPLLVQERDERSLHSPNWSPLTLGQLSFFPPLAAGIASVSTSTVKSLDYKASRKA